MKEETKKYVVKLKELMKVAFEGKILPPSVSETNFGTSIYVQDENVKMRFSDHGVGINRFSENLWSLESLFLSEESVIQALKENFSDHYTSLFVRGSQVSNKIYPVARIHKSDKKNWDQVAIKTTKVISKEVLLSELGEYDIVSEGGLTKKGDKKHCKIRRVCFRRGVFNNKTKQLIEVYQLEISKDEIDKEKLRVIDEKTKKVVNISSNSEVKKTKSKGFSM